MLLAQIETGNWEWWANYGVLGALVFITISAFLYYFNDWWQTRKPHVEKRLAAEVDKERAAEGLFNALKDTEPMKMELLKQQKTLLESALTVQMAHAADCRSTREKVDEIHHVIVRHPRQEKH